MKGAINLKNFEKCIYTYRHRKAIKYLIEKLIADEQLKTIMLQRAATHDMDKMVMYQVLDYSEAHRIHRAISTHHMTNSIPKSYYDYVEAILDYESAGYTKPDKPMNAYDFVVLMRNTKKFDEETCKILLGICAELGINKSYSVTEDVGGMDYLNSCLEVTEEMIIKELTAYFEGSIV